MSPIEDDLCRMVANEASESNQLIDLHCLRDFIPITKRTVTYIVCVVLFNQKGEILFMQEAKPSCFGKWYLPAGRVEPNESIVAAAKRELTEETGLTFEPTTLISIEIQGMLWYRFTFTGQVTGGALKTESEKDSESLQAKWYDIDEVRNGKIDVRCYDILEPINAAVNYNTASVGKRTLGALPLCISHRKMLLRYVILNLSESSGSFIKSTGSVDHFPLLELDPQDQLIYIPVKRLLKAVFGSKDLQLTFEGALQVEYGGGGTDQGDGLCLTLVYTSHEQRTVLTGSHYCWHTVTDDRLLSLLIDIVKHKRLVPILP